METYLEIFDTRTDDIRKTGLGAAFETEEETRQAFQKAKALENEGGGFLLDLYVDGNLIDTIELSANGVEVLTGEEPKTPEFYTAYDKDETMKALLKFNPTTAVTQPKENNTEPQRIVRTDREIDDVINTALEAIEEGSQFTGCTYEEGIYEMYRWLTREDAENPMTP